MLSIQPVRCHVGGARAADAGPRPTHRRSRPHLRRPAGTGRDLLRAALGLPVADDPPRPAALGRRLPLVPAMELRRHLRPHPRRTTGPGPRGRRAGPEPLRRRAGRPVDQVQRRRTGPRLRRGQEDHRPQTTPHRRHPRAAPGRDGHRRLGPRPPRRTEDPATPGHAVPHHRPGLGRRRIRQQHRQHPSSAGPRTNSACSCRSSNAATTSRASRSCPAGGWSSGPSAG